MNQAQIDYYNSLSDDKKNILKIAALKAGAISELDVAGLFFYRKVTQRFVRDVLDVAVLQTLFYRQKTYKIEYYVDLDFMLYIYPELSDLEPVWTKIQANYNSFFYAADGPVVEFRNCLFSLLHVPEEYPKHEASFLDSLTPEKVNFYVRLIQGKEYESKLCLISPELINTALTSALNARLYTLRPLYETKRFFEYILQYSRSTYDTTFMDKTIAFHTGNFAESIAMIKEDDVLEISYNEAVAAATEGDVDKAFACFDKALKIHRRTSRDLIAPTSLHAALYYFATLLNADPKIATPVFRKMEQWLTKNSGYPGTLSIFSIVVYHVLNMKEREMEKEPQLIEGISGRAPESEYVMLIALPAYFMTGREMNASMADAVYSLVSKAYSAGYTILAYEAAYAMKSWFDNKRSNSLYDKVASKLSYSPVISHIVHQEDWEKSLNLLMGMRVAPSKTTKDGENKARVVYFFNPKYNYLQPVLQTRQTRGWSTGRNVGMKNFFECKTQGMSEQDMRIAKTMKHINDYYNESYEFTEEVYPQLVGHPYVFLESSKDIPVEFIAAQPIIKVTKSPQGYALSTNTKEITKRISVQKETNTRYLVYDLTPQQMQILQIVAGQSIVVPEKGKDRLIQLLGAISVQGMSVHSDLLDSESTQVQVEEVPSDSRIHIQLLPFGDGLKAELFSKPFGGHPPYCKPGKGGKVLIANENNIQRQVKRDLKMEMENETVLLNEIQSLESLDMTGGLMTFSDPLDSLSVLDILLKYQDISVVEWPEGERFRIRSRVGFGNLSIRMKSGINWFDLEGELKVDENTVVPLRQLLDLTGKTNKRFVELSPGEFIALSSDLKKQLDELRLFSTIGKDEVKINKFASVVLDDFFDRIEHLETDQSWKQFRKQIDSVKANDIALPAHLNVELRAYQEEGFQWLARLAGWESGACLADDMGLGKTLQTLAVLLHRAQQGPAMVICPVSVISNWVNEASRFAPTLQVKILANSLNRKETMQSLEPGDLLIISYGLLQTETEMLIEQPFATIVLDEAHIIKNYATKTSRASMQLKAPFRVALTGTPIQNHLGEIWNIFNFINPGLLGSLDHFTDTFIKSDDEKKRKYLKKLISPFILRRTKTAVLDELPPKTEIVKKIQLSAEEKAFYETMRRKAIENLSRDDVNSGVKHIQILTEITKLRKACCHPQMIDPDTRIASSKLATFLEIVSELRENKHRALVFSQFVTHLSIVRKALDEQGVSYQCLDGSMSMAERERRVKKFQGGEGDLFLISLKVGGMGLNLTAADFVIHLDPWWNPAVEDQASDRAHRIGQLLPVTIYRLVAEDTIEEKIIQLHHTKRGLAESLLEGSDRSARLSLTELISLIKERDT
ncbi:MAG: DEAD/DEAH box helicase [Tannerellaceae bacterium]|jgi:superfamily II DNA or RNA helicase|nr:DEAD/DEAH box helicase [Tannerellaceae bacterium]